MQSNAKKMLKEKLVDYFVPDPLEITSSLSQQVASNIELETEEMIQQRKLKEVQKEKNIQKVHYAVMTTAGKYVFFSFSKELLYFLGILSNDDFNDFLIDTTVLLASIVIFIEWNTLCFLAFSILLFNAPYATYQRRQIFKMKSK